MITRRTTLLLADLLDMKSRHQHYHYNNPYYSFVWSEVYDFFFANEYPAWLCNAAKYAASNCIRSTRQFTDFVLKIHTGESLVTATENWSWPQREKLGQQLLRDLAEDTARLLEGYKSTLSSLDQFKKSLELDGYVFRGDVLLSPEEEVLDVKEESGVLRELYRELNLPNQDTVFHHLTLSEEHYLATRWDDSISNSRKFLEGVLQEVAASHHLASKGSAIDSAIYSRPARVREYMESNGLLESKEKGALSSLYALLSETGGHPYMAENDQARLLRHLALTFSQFALLRLKGYKADKTP